MNKIEKTKQDLTGQATALTRLVNHSKYTVVEIANKVGVNRQTIYKLMNGDVATPEDKIEKLGRLFNKKPAELRYDISVFNVDDLKLCVKILEDELNQVNKIMPSEKKSELIAWLYETMQEYKRSLNNDFSIPSFLRTAKKTMDFMINN
jgi:predicted transcriptional regulator